ncbi:MAG: molecular chaperone SurA, partial [Thiomicrorhabdus sp.]|nr:molecular chaperone SurA [Thiomicrorhabdus sp.]
MKKTLHSVFFSLTMALATAATTSATADDVLLDKVVAVVNDQVILQSELAASVFEQSQKLAAQNIPVNDVDALRKKVLDSLILEVLQVERAKQIGLSV